MTFHDEEPTESMDWRERLVGRAVTLDIAPEMIGLSEVLINKLHRVCGDGDDRKLEALIWTVLRFTASMGDRVDEALALVADCCEAARLK